MKIGEVIRTLRKYKNISQTELAQKCEISATSLSQIEKDSKRPSRTTMAKICIALEVPESLIYVMGTEDTDVPADRKEVFNTVFPTLKRMFMNLITDEKELKALSRNVSNVID